ncbi:MAG TPA: hypothetical protein VGE50_12640 [Gammaproteobacteria bacterium]
MNSELSSPFHQAWRGYFSSLLRWDDLERFWETLRHTPGPWYIYAIGEPVPTTPADQVALERFIAEIDALLRKEHEEDYCGIVYADSTETPSLIKIYDPNNLGSSCGSSGNQPPPLPGWVLSTLPPVDMQTTTVLPANRRRWWQKLFS